MYQFFLEFLIGCAKSARPFDLNSIAYEAYCALCDEVMFDEFGLNYHF